MTAATYTSDLSDISLFESTTNVSAYGGGAAGLTAETEFAMEGTNAVDKQVTSSAEKGFMYDAGTDFTIGADDHFYIWMYSSVFGINDTYQNRGIHVSIGDSTSAFVKFHVDGINTLPFGGGKPYAVRFVNTSSTNQRTLVSTPGTTPQTIGGGLNVTGNSKDVNLGIDGARIGWGYTITNGTGADPEADFAGIESDDSSTSEGVLQLANGGYNLTGKLKIGSTATECEFKDANTNIYILSSFHHLSDFAEILIENASSIVTLTNVSFISIPDPFPADGSVTTNRGRLEVVTDTATLTFKNVSFIGTNDTVLGSGSTLDSCNWISTGRIDLNEADISGSNIITSTVAADEGAIFDDRTTTAATSISELDNCTISQGTNAHHAIRFGANVNDEITLTGIEFTGFSSSPDVNGSTLRFDATSGSMNVNLVNCTVDGNPATDANVGVDDAAGITVTLVVSPKTTKVNVVSSSGADIQDARVFLETSDNGGGSGLAYQAATSTLTQTGGTATLTSSTAHGLKTNDYVVVRGANVEGYNKTAQITVSSTTVFTYSVGAGIGSPAGGTPVFSYCPISGLTDSNGEIQSSKTWPASQGLTGWVRKSTASPYYKETMLSVSDASGGTDLLVALQPDD